jgi:ABC-type amino acid transport substrate-binding protein
VPAAQVPELEVEEVIGIREQPALGIKRPEVYDPLHDPVWQAGFRETFPSEVPEDLKHVDGLTRARALGRLVACADAWYYPFTVSARKAEPPGIDIEVLRLIAGRKSWAVEMVWTETGKRGGLGAAFGRTIDRGYCDLFLGLVITGEDDETAQHRLTFTRPYMGQGFILVLQGRARTLGVKSLADLKPAGLRIGVPVYTPMHAYLNTQGVDNEGYFGNHGVIDALAKGEIDAAMLWSGAVGEVKKEHPNLRLEMPPGYVPELGQRFNAAWAVPARDHQLKQFLDEWIATLLQEGEIRRIVEKYGVPFYPPFSN